MIRTNRTRRWAVIPLFSCGIYHPTAGTLDELFTSIPQFSEVNLTAEGALDWVHWGLYMDTSVTRKAGVTNQISDFSVVGKGGFTGLPVRRQLQRLFVGRWHAHGHGFKH